MGEVYDPARQYRPGEDVPRHGAHRSKRKKKRDEPLPARGAAVAGTGRPKGADKG